jgi:hypothetical protein
VAAHLARHADRSGRSAQAVIARAALNHGVNDVAEPGAFRFQHADDLEQQIVDPDDVSHGIVVLRKQDVRDRAPAGHHRFSWDLRYDPLAGGGGGRGGGAGGAVPHRTFPGANAPWVAPGTYSVRLTVDGNSATQPIVVKIDPRVRVTPAIQQVFTLTTRMEDGARAAEKAKNLEIL